MSATCTSRIDSGVRCALPDGHDGCHRNTEEGWTWHQSSPAIVVHMLPAPAADAPREGKKLGPAPAITRRYRRGHVPPDAPRGAPEGEAKPTTICGDLYGNYVCRLPKGHTGAHDACNGARWPTVDHTADALGIKALRTEVAALRAALATAEREREALREAMQRLRRSGSGLANAAYNLAQRGSGQALTSEEAMSLRAGYQDWDFAMGETLPDVLAARSTPRTGEGT